MNINRMKVGDMDSVLRFNHRSFSHLISNEKKKFPSMGKHFLPSRLSFPIRKVYSSHVHIMSMIDSNSFYMKSSYNIEVREGTVRLEGEDLHKCNIFSTSLFASSLSF